MVENLYFTHLWLMIDPYCLLDSIKCFFLSPAAAGRVENLYFTYLFVLRAAMKAGPILEAAHFDTGSPEEDARTKELVKRRVITCIC